MENFKLILKRNQKNMRMHFNDAGVLVVSAPSGIKKSDLISFINNNKTWIEQHKAQIPTHTYADGDYLMLFGEKYEINVIKGENRKITLNDGIMTITSLHPLDKSSIQEQLYYYYCDKLIEFITPRIKYWADKLNVSCPRFQICNAKTRWGVCYPTKNFIRFSAITASLDPKYIDLIIVHELCHLKERNHQKPFWDLMCSVLPETPILEKQFKAIDRSGLHKNLF